MANGGKRLRETCAQSIHLLPVFSRRLGGAGRTANGGQGRCVDQPVRVRPARRGALVSARRLAGVAAGSGGAFRSAASRAWRSLSLFAARFLASDSMISFAIR